jgi:hypothetical protein
MSFLGVRQRGRGGFDGTFVRIVVAILVMFVHSVAGISTFSTISQVTHPDIRNRVDNQPIISALLDCLRNERNRGQEATGEDPFLDKVDFTLIYPSA